MMGMTLEDPDHVESAGGSVRGMGLLPVDTEFREEKIKSQVKGRFRQIGGVLNLLSGLEVDGYQLHMGVTGKRGCSPGLTDVARGRQDLLEEGIQQGSCYGTYIHGIFDSGGVARAVAESLLKAKGMELTGEAHADYGSYKERQYDELAAGLRKHLDMPAIYNLMGVNR